MSPFKTPVNKIKVTGNPIIEECKIEDATNLYAGRLVKKGSTDGEIVVNTAAGKAVGWLGYEGTSDLYKPATVDTIFTVEAFVPVLKGGNFIINGRLASGQSVAKGDPLVAAANGELKAASALAVAVPAGATPVTSDAAQPDLTESGSLPPEGMIVAIAEETVDASAGAKDIMVRSLI